MRGQAAALANEEASEVADEGTPGESIGVFGGSFDPVHVGHLAAAEEAARELGLARVILVPAGIPPHKPSGTCASSADRLAMLAMAIRGRERLDVSDIEVRRQGTSYTVDTLRELGAELGEEARLHLLIGTDALRELHTWWKIDEIFRLAEPAVLERPGEPPADWEALGRLLPEDIVRRARARVVPLHRGVEVASSDVRKRLAAGESIEGLVPPEVEGYIRERSLYMTPPE
ncbi:MAG: nicotinate-nucleotide adenylyltransferase [Planctomycetota bacterium]|jgi:nicotinate-nucleotide adenylyltransferase